MAWLRHYKWFWKESFSFMKGTAKYKIIWGCIRMAHKFATDMVKWDKMTAAQREELYLSGKGRIFEV